MVRALQVVKGEGVSLAEVAESEIGEGDVVVDVDHSSLNYKDALVLAGRPGVVRTDRLIAGIDLVGTVRSSESDDWAPGDRVLINGCTLSETHDGGLAELARVRSEWLVRVPERFTGSQAAAVGTAGFTAALAVLALERGAVDGAGITPGDGEILVTGATGGLGSIAIMLLARRGHTVAAVTGKADRHDYLRGLGAATIVDRRDLDVAGKPLQSERWAGAVDAVGGPILSTVLAQLRAGASVAVCGNAASVELDTTVLPLIIRGVSLIGTNSVLTPRPLRLAAWKLLDDHLDLDLLDSLTTSIALDEAIGTAERLLAGDSTGRVVVDVQR